MARRSEPDLHGLIVVDKPPHHTSHDIVARIRRLTGIRRVGHAGTLDPFATGVVVVAVGRATRVLQFVQDTDKVYLAHVVLGAETDTADVEGNVLSRFTGVEWPSRLAVEKALGQFIGEVEQIPPVYSAIKVGGQPLYKQARAGIEVDVPVRTVQIHSIELVDYDPPDVVLLVRCGKGTYIRAVARDLGASLGTSGYCHGLRRIASGDFALDQAWTLDDLEIFDPRQHWHEIAVHPDFALHELPAIVLSGDQTQAWYHGQSFAVDYGGLGPGTRVRVYGSSGEFAGVAVMTEDAAVKPQFVFKTSGEGE